MVRAAINSKCSVRALWKEDKLVEAHAMLDVMVPLVNFDLAKASVAPMPLVNNVLTQSGAKGSWSYLSYLDRNERIPCARTK